MSLTNLTLKAAVDGLAAGEFTSVELTKAHIEAIEAARAEGQDCAEVTR